MLLSDKVTIADAVRFVKLQNATQAREAVNSADKRSGEQNGRTRRLAVRTRGGLFV
jgi:hypothetical protein